MSKNQRTVSAGPDAEAAPSPSRRGWVVGVGVAGAAALAAHALRTGASAAEPIAAAAAPKAGAENDGYRLTDHVRRYYETTKA
jgi:hypothetical protein